MSDRQDLAYQLWLAGSTYAEIAATKDPKTGRQLYASPSGAFAAVRAVRARQTDAAAEPESRTSLIDAEIARLDRLQRALWSGAIGGDPMAAREVRQLILARARLRGLDGAHVAPDEQKGNKIDDLTARRERRRQAAGG